jgi:hypothetical protein
MTTWPLSGEPLTVKWCKKLCPSKSGALTLLGGITAHTTSFTVNRPTRTDGIVFRLASMIVPSAT